MAALASLNVNIRRRSEMIFVAHGAGAKAFGRASTTQAPTTHRNAPKSSDNDTPSPLARSSEMNRPMAARPRDVSGCTFLHDLTGRSERLVKVKTIGLAKASRERSAKSERKTTNVYRFSPRTIHPIERDGL